MRKLLISILIIALCVGICGCTTDKDQQQIVATTLPVFELATKICQGTDLTISKLINENISCLHDYTLQTKHLRMLESANLILSTGLKTDIFLSDVLQNDARIVDTSANVPLLHSAEASKHTHNEHCHNNEFDHHIWLSPANCKLMAENIYNALCDHYPQHTSKLTENFNGLIEDLTNLQNYGNQVLASLSSRDLITFHDGFAYFADAFNLNILKAIEEESGAEASAAELIDIIATITEHNVVAIFTETNSSSSAAGIISAETGVSCYTLDMAMAGDSWFAAMYHNIDTIKEALE